MSTDPELKALQTVLETLSDLEDEAARARILDYVSRKLGVVAGPKVTPLTAGAAAKVASMHVAQPELFESFADLFDAARPQTDADKALVTGYWLQVCRGAQDFGSQSVNDELKHLGYAIGNITRALDALTSMRPNPVQQTRKDGTTKQARKTFRVTVEGKKKVEQMIAKAADADASPKA